MLDTTETNKRSGTERRLAVSSQNVPTGNGDIVLKGVLHRIHNMASVSSIPFNALAPLREDLTARSEAGEKKYGTPLRTRNGRVALVDLYQEVLDAMMYSMQGRMEGDGNGSGRFFELLVGLASQIAVELNKRP